MNDKFYVTDCEGPLSINDNAYEISDYFIPEGGEFFSILSNYDDMLVEKNTEGYLAGSTLKLILPFFKAYDLTENDLIQFSEDNINMLDGAYTMISYVQKIMPCYIVSTSYNQYIKALCEKTGFKYENTYSTQLNMDKYDLNDEERESLLNIRENILFDYSFENIDHLFNDVISKMQISTLMDSVTPVGGIGKRNAILDIIENQNYEPSNLMYSGDSITDCEALEFTKENEGISISFNGNNYSINSASISITSTNNLILALIADIFNNKSSNAVYDFINEYNEDSLETIIKYSGNNEITQELLLNKASIDLVTEDNVEELYNKSKIIRNKVRGQKIGNLG
ncbi:MAG: hypothetical protein BZ138_02850 [Methanosphaera sp. rholeuAM270]|nr:MAG: hypothetical protein BZ138_02850 [Methanosphaera sp. rholeuAM270]